MLRNKALFVVSAEFARLIIYLFKIQAASNTQEIFQRLPFTIQSRSLLSQIFNLLEGEDVLNTLKVMKMLGANIKKKDGKYIVFGIPPGALFEPTKSLDFGNSGTGIRLLSGIISSNNIKAKLAQD